MATGPDPTPVGPQPGAVPVADQILIMLVGGPRNAHQERVAYGTTDVKANVDGVEHDYQLGANLPDDFAQRVPAPHYPTQYFGYNGPDQAMVDALLAEYPPAAPPDGITRGPEHGPAFGAAKGKPAKPLTTEDFPT